ncbi:sugar MFS transporter [Teredinibacter sp. KSP-S5-2]|uniref:sugar MFS transporter n=1 Tax=Teredinibacter sp. KSP-S5-2 TaxID=3034506 RepID=UPI002934CFAC|nr:sugar MFS transporter [Teredinibacter sp. KSP-S5-2]WNO09307.1 sugar MFS transporter [Teredinibacter sp. KSP-S5-2]
MAGGIPSTGSTKVASGGQSTGSYKFALALMVSLFFVIGFITVLNDVLLPRLKGLFELSNRDAMLIMFVFFGAYLVWAYPAGSIVKVTGYKRGIIIALCTMAVGLGLFIPAAQLVMYPVFLLALFVTASGLTILQVCINPYIIALGPEETGASRLNLGGALNSTATFIGPIIGGAFILQHVTAPDYPSADAIDKVQSVYEVQVDAAEEKSSLADLNRLKEVLSHPAAWQDESGQVQVILGTLNSVDAPSEDQAESLLNQVKPSLKTLFASDEFKAVDDKSEKLWWDYKLEKANSVLLPYVALCVVCFLVAGTLFFIKLPILAHEEAVSEEDKHRKLYGSAFDYLHMKLGALAIFFYVGVEVSIGAVLILYLENKEMGGLSHQHAAYLLAYYWGSAMIGRFIGSYVGTKLSAELLLRVVVVAAIILLALSFMPPLLNTWLDIPVLALVRDPFSIGFINVHVPVAAVCLVLCGLCHSVMWPSIFPLGIAKLGRHTSQGSGVLVMGVFGGAVIPLTIGWIADHAGYKLSFLICMLCYVYILFYAVKGYRMGKINELKEGEFADTHAE